MIGVIFHGDFEETFLPAFGFDPLIFLANVLTLFKVQKTLQKNIRRGLATYLGRVL